MVSKLGFANVSVTQPVLAKMTNGGARSRQAMQIF
jgi:hypothetical protein